MTYAHRIICTSILMGSLFPLYFFDAQAFTSIQLTVDGISKEQLTISDISQFTKNTSYLVHEPGYTSEIEKVTQCTSLIEPCLLTTTVREEYSTKIITQTTVNNEKVKTFVEDIARKIDQDPINARLRFNAETKKIEEIASHADGIQLDSEQNIKKIAAIITENPNQLPEKIELVFHKNPATVTSTNAQEIGIKELIGEGTSDFSGSTKSRIHNISTAAKRFDGLVIAPGEEFSFVSILGPVDGEHGYEEELVIIDNETKPEYGGGICQVSTTVFRGAIFSGMKITQRHNHSYPVHYYMPIGFDATVYVPSPDFRFINNTPGHILLNVAIEGTELKFYYYGTNDQRNVVMEGPFITDRQPDGAMKTYFTQKVTTKTGDVLIDDIFKSNYKSPNDYPHPGDVAKLTSKPDNWSKKEWDVYKTENGL